uniref:Major facilitator superfamily (MFS) profile domain-containing protein n=1 Tax=Spongospora subterranea TaxID=70186 RepID=A0A0H5R7E7_9EUKA|eukprot:CRZ10075.1 hypothetical protein [Spongospora subterranea]
MEEYEEQQIEHLIPGNSLEYDADEPSILDKDSVLSVWSDMNNILVLVLLYTIQGVPLGLTFGSVPFMLQSSSSYTDIGVFSFASYPYSLKLLWSPIVDSIFSEDMGRRKSWIVPIQLMVGLILVTNSSLIENYVLAASGASHHHDIRVLTMLFFIVILLVATQDIAVDGWALSMLSKDNRGLASTCQSIGQNIGFFMSYTIFLALSSPSFCNQWIRKEPLSVGITSLSSYIYFWGWVMIVSTLLIWLFKTEKRSNMKQSLLGVYYDIWDVIQLPAMRSLLVILLTAKLAFSGADNVTILKLVEKGFPREAMALMVFLSFPFDILLPILVSRWARADGNTPLSAYIFAFPIRIGLTLVGATLVYFFPSDPQEHSIMFYVLAFSIQVLYSFTSNAMFVALCTFFAEIADVRIGGTYMTLLNTVTNLGGTWPKFFVLYFVDQFTSSTCTDEGVCTIYRDGYYVVCGACACYGLVWWLIMRRRILAVQMMDKSAWKVQTGKHE